MVTCSIRKTEVYRHMIKCENWKIQMFVYAFDFLNPCVFLSERMCLPGNINGTINRQDYMQTGLNTCKYGNKQMRK